ARRDDKTHAALEQRRCNHENDEQDKREIQQWRDVDLAQRRQVIALRITSHRRNAGSRTPGSTNLCSKSEASSAAKVSISTSIARMLVTKKLYRKITGIRRQRPGAAVISAA